MRKSFILLIVPLIYYFVYKTVSYNQMSDWDNTTAYKAVAQGPDSSYYPLYGELGLGDKVSYEAFEQAMAGYDIIEKKKPVLTLIDFSKPSTDERLYVINIEKKKILYKSVVSHGKNSGGNYVSSFSNKLGSCQSSLGFFVTENTYQGRNGLSLVINGLEKGINDNAKRRSVVIHGADYAGPKVGRTAGRLGRSLGCPALPPDLAQPIINAIKDGSVIYAYCEKFNEEYLKHSSILAEYSHNADSISDLLSSHSLLPKPNQPSISHRQG